MTEKEPSPEQDDAGDDIDLEGGGGIAARIVSSAAKEMGYVEVAKIINQWPELMGKAIAIPHNKIMELVKQGKPIPQKLADQAQRAIVENPDDAVLLLGPLVAASFDDALDAKAERELILSSYMQRMNIVAQVSESRKTSLALAGFIHSADCISYWHRTSLRGGKLRLSVDRLVPGSGLQLYLLDIMPSEEDLTLLNETIRRSSDRQLPKDLWNHNENEHSSRLQEIYEMKIVVDKLDPDREKKAKEAAGKPFNLVDFDRPQSFDIEIPNKAPALPAMFESLFFALNVQLEHLKGIKESLAESDTVLSKLDSDTQR